MAPSEQPHLLSQTARSKLELVIVAPSKVLLDLELDQLNEFACYQVVEIKKFQSIGQANAAGIRQAAARIVALAEEHCFTDPKWAENLISAHQGPWAAVGPGVRNAYPNTAVSWADLFIGYGPWLTPAPSMKPMHFFSAVRVLSGFSRQTIWRLLQDIFTTSEGSIHPSVLPKIENFVTGEHGKDILLCILLGPLSITITNLT